MRIDEKTGSSDRRRLRDELTPYDASYLALAEVLPEPLLVTADAGLAAVAERRLGAGAVGLLA